MKNHEFTMLAAQVAKRASSYAHDNLVMGHEHAIKDLPPERAKWFCDEIKSILIEIEVIAGLTTVREE